MKLRFLFTLFALLTVSLNALVAQNVESGDTTIVGHINASGKVVVSQPSGIAARLARVVEEGDIQDGDATDANRVVGYRVQVFSDNNHRTAKNEAQSKERNIISRFPTIATYISYNAPAWRLRVGDFRTLEEAEDCLNEIKKAFPSYSRELIIVRDRINTK